MKDTGNKRITEKDLSLISYLILLNFNTLSIKLIAFIFLFNINENNIPPEISTMFLPFFAILLF